MPRSISQRLNASGSRLATAIPRVTARTPFALLPPATPEQEERMRIIRQQPASQPAAQPIRKAALSLGGKAITSAQEIARVPTHPVESARRVGAGVFGTLAAPTVAIARTGEGVLWEEGKGNELQRETDDWMDLIDNTHDRTNILREVGSVAGMIPAWQFQIATGTMGAIRQGVDIGREDIAAGRPIDETVADVSKTVLPAVINLIAIKAGPAASRRLSSLILPHVENKLAAELAIHAATFPAVATAMRTGEGIIEGKPLGESFTEAATSPQIFAEALVGGGLPLLSALNAQARRQLVRAYGSLENAAKAMDAGATHPILQEVMQRRLKPTAERGEVLIPGREPEKPRDRGAVGEGTPRPEELAGTQVRQPRVEAPAESVAEVAPPVEPPKASPIAAAESAAPLEPSSSERPMRGFAERVAEYPQFEPEAERLKAEERFRYTPQEVKRRRIEEQPNMSDDQLRISMERLASRAEMPSQENFDAMDTAELLRRMDARGEDVMPILERMAKSGTGIAQLLNQFKEVKNATPQSVTRIFERVLSMNERYLTPEQRTQHTALSRDNIAAARRLHEAEKNFNDNPTEQTARDRDKAYREADNAANRVLDFEARKVPRQIRDMWSQAIQGNLLSPISVIARNPFSNITVVPLRFAYHDMAAAGDYLWSKIRNKPQEIARLRVMPYLKGGAQGLLQAVESLWTGRRPGQGISGEQIRGFRPIAGLKDLFTGEGLARNKEGKIALSDRLKAGFEGTFGVAPETMFRLLNLGDLPFSAAYKGTLIDEQARLKGLTGQDRLRFMENQRHNPTEQIETEMLQSVFQQKNKLAQYIRGFGNLLGPAKPLFTAVLPYTQTPMNMMFEGMQFISPELSLSLAAHAAIKGNRRLAMQYVGKAVIGKMLTTAAFTLLRNGILAGDPQGQQDKETRLRYNTQYPNTMNVSAIERMLRGESPEYRPGDELKDYRSMGYIGVVLNAVANHGDAMIRDGEVQAKEQIQNPSLPGLSVSPEIGSSIMNLAMMKGTYDAIGALKDKEYEQWFKNYWQSLGAGAIPRTIQAQNRSTQEYLKTSRGYHDTTMGFETAIRQMIGSEAAMAPFRHVRDLFGRPVKTIPEGSNRVVYTFMDPMRTRYAPSDSYSEKVREVFESTRNNDAIPPKVEDSITIGGQTIKLTLPQADMFEELVGEYRRKNMDRISGWNRMNTERKLEALTNSYAVMQSGSSSRSTILRKLGLSEYNNPALIEQERILHKYGGGRSQQDEQERILRKYGARQ